MVSKVVGSKPILHLQNKNSPVAQLVEHSAVNRRVEGSSPFRGEKKEEEVGN